jgi:hypothetical protein
MKTTTGEKLDMFFLVYLRNAGDDGCKLKRHLHKWKMKLRSLVMGDLIIEILVFIDLIGNLLFLQRVPCQGKAWAFLSSLQ